MIIIDCEQGSEEWFAARVGIPSASNFDKIITAKGEPSKSAKKYMLQLAGERIIGDKEESYQNAAITRGIEMEGEARAFFEMLHGPVEQVGLIYKDENKDTSCSPDGLPKDTGLEIKCPSLAVHVEYLLGNKLPTTYFQQVQGSMFVTGFSSWWFMSYYPGMNPLIIKVDRDIMFMGKLGKAIKEFNEKLDKIHQQLLEG